MTAQVGRQVADAQPPVRIAILRAARLHGAGRRREALRPREMLLLERLGRAIRVVVEMQQAVHLQLGRVRRQFRHQLERRETGLDRALAGKRHAEQVLGVGADQPDRRHGLEQRRDLAVGISAETRVGEVDPGFVVGGIEGEEMPCRALENLDVHRGEADAGEIAPPVVAFGRELDGAAQREDRLVVTAQQREQLAHERVAGRDRGRRITGAQGGDEGRLELARFGERAGEAFEGQEVTGREVERRAMPRDRFVEPALAAQTLRQIGDEAGLAGPQLDGAPAVTQRVLGPPEPAQRDAQEIVGIRVVGPQLEQAPAAPLGALGMSRAQLLLRLQQQTEAGVRGARRAGQRRGLGQRGLRRHARAADRDGAGSSRSRRRAGGRPGGRYRSAAALSG